MLLRRLGLLVLVAAAYVTLGALFCSATLHVQRRTGPAPPGAEAVTMRAQDGSQLKAWWMPANGDRCILSLHGVADSRASGAALGQFLREKNFSVLAPDSRAHGESGGELVTYGLLEKYDVGQWVNWMQQHGCRGVYGLGESLGASILIQAAAEGVPFTAIVAECPFADLRTVAEYRVARMAGSVPVVSTLLAKAVVSSAALWARFAAGVDLAAVSPVKSFARRAVRTLLIHGLADDQTPPSNSRELAAASPLATLWLVPGARHVGAYSAAPEEFRRRVIEFFSR